MNEGKREFSPFDTSHPVTTITTGPIFCEPRAIMIQHGCTILDPSSETCVITFPEGTQRQEIFLRTLCERYRILFPDGFEMRQVYDRFQERSQLYIVVQGENASSFPGS